MSTTPPKKGQKRPAPQTPRGKPPAKASRASSPSETTEFDVLHAGRPTPSKTGAIPAIPPFWPRAGPSQPPPAASTSADQMEEDPIEVAEEHADEPDELAFYTAPNAMDDAEAESSYKELLDWMRYLAQHKEQRGRLLDLFTAAIASLQGLPGSGVPEIPAVPAESSYKELLDWMRYLAQHKEQRGRLLDLFM